MHPAKPTSVYLLEEIFFEHIYGADERRDIAQLTHMLEPRLTTQTWQDHPLVCAKAEIIFSGWGMPLVTSRFLELFPKLHTIFYAAGSIKGFATNELWERGITVTCSNTANAIPVCEYTIAQIILATKHVWRLAHQTRINRTYNFITDSDIPGMYGSVIGLISLGSIGRMVAERLRQFQVKVIAYDPFVTQEEAAAAGVQLCSLDEVFQLADVVSCHTPWLKETEAMLTRRHFHSMKANATFINTARGAVVDEPALIATLVERPDLCAVLDITYPEPAVSDSPLYTLPNVLLTPHIAGSIGQERYRLGRTMVDELQRYLQGKPLQYKVHREQIVTMA